MENREQLPTIIHQNEDKTLKISYFGEDYVYIETKDTAISVHLGDVEWLIWQLQNI